MTKFGVILFVVYLKTNVITVSSRPRDTTMFYQTNNKIIKIIDDLFFSLKNGKRFTRSKRADEYMSRHRLVQDAICNNHKIYKKVRDMSKTKISNKIAYFISNINEVIEVMIRSEAVEKYDIRNDVNISTLEYESVKHFVTLASRFNLKLKTFASAITVPKLNRSKGNSQEEARRIFAGSSTGIARYPFMVSVHVAGRFVCAGSLLHESLVLSAASCLMSSVHTKPHVQIRVASDYVSKMGSLVNIEKLIFHPEFNRATLANNLVLLQTKKVLRFRKQLVVAIQYDRDATSVLRSDVEDLVILGWGRRRMDEIDREEDRPLSEGHLQLYNFDACQYIYSRDFVTDKSFCAGFVDRAAGACNHDAGGPALVSNVLVGVISFGSSRCGAADAPTVFSRIGLYAEWIDGVFKKLEESHGVTSEEQINSSENILRNEVTDLDQAMRDIYKDNFNVDEVLYGPIETLYDEATNISTKLILKEYPTDPKMFPNPELVANIASPKTPKPFEPPEGYWRDYSIEQTPNEDHKLPANQFGNDTISYLYSTTHQAFTENTDIYNLQDVYADSEENVTFAPTTKMTEEAFYVDENNEYNVNPQIYDPKNTIYEEDSKEEPKRTSKGAKLRENLNNAVISTSDPVRYTQLFKKSSRNTMTYKPDKLKRQRKAKIENAQVNEKAVIVMSDSGTTRRIEVNKNNPIYQQGFKMLADKIIRKEKKKKEKRNVQT